ncbi:outer membrane protein assembly factor BamB family protein, partial [Microlunatus antarcticus]|uniref:outer membrane protein assembly factor BamB family protein n=1 Tax=Microlunatus antarcticus TaxID=53388 RepID=UPI00160EC886
TRTTATNGKYTTVLSTATCSRISVYRTSTGKKVWRKAFFEVSSIVSDGTFVYAYTEDVNGNNNIEARRISNGKRQWRHRASSSPRNLVVGSGVVVNGSQVLDAKSGKLKYYLPEPTGETSNDPYTLVVGGRLYRNTNAEVGAWSAKGTLLWLYTKTGEHFEGPGEGESLVQYHAGRIYVREATADEKPTLVLDAATGVKLGELPFTAQPLAFDGPVAIFTQKHWPDNDRVSVQAVDLDDSHVYWTKTYVAQNPEGRMSLLTPPVIENGLVWFNLDDPAGDRSILVALDEVTGQQESSTSLACRLRGHHSDGAAFGTLGVAQHRLFVPSTCGLQTFKAR